MLLDNQSTDDTLNNPRLLSNVHEVLCGIKTSTNGGGLTTNLKGYLENFDHMWSNKNAMVNALSAHGMEKHRHSVDYSTKKDGMFHVTAPTGKHIEFKPSPSGSHCHDARESAITMLNAVAENKSGHSA